ncbi:MAG: FliH/SctL family protein [Acidimicrobiales bacterium]
MLRGGEVADLPVVDFINPPMISDPPAVDEPEPGGATDSVPGTQSPDAEDGPSSADVDEAYDRGWAEGLAAARADIDAAARAQEALARSVADMQTAFDSRWTATAELIGDLAIEIAGLILARETSSATDPGRDAIVRCLAEAGISAPATFRLNPLDLAELGDIDDLVAGRSIELVADPTVASGDAIVDVEGGRIDGTIAGALQRVAEVLGS